MLTAEALAEVAESSIAQSSYVYDPDMKMYYDKHSKCYYDAVSHLLFILQFLFLTIECIMMTKIFFQLKLKLTNKLII